MLSFDQEYQPGLHPAPELLVFADHETKAVSVEERDVQVPLISLTLRHFYHLTMPVFAGERYGMQMGAKLRCMWDGHERQVHGVVVPLLNGPDIVVPLGFFTGGGPH